jgi:murein DD-endopeptidase / murein LD-carboxypeptidase
MLVQLQFGINKKLLFFLLPVLIFTACFSGKNRQSKKYAASIITYHKPDTAKATKKISAEQYHDLKVEFGKRLSVSPDSILNGDLYAFIKQWLGTPYLWGGSNEYGIDCSAFVQRLYQQVYNINVPRTSIEQFYTKRVELYSNTKYLTEGDLVFFKTLINSNSVTHVGFYLHNGYFVNASSAKGVSLGNLNDYYWRNKYVACGRLKNPKTFTAR